MDRSRRNEKWIPIFLRVIYFHREVWWFFCMWTTVIFWSEPLVHNNSESVTMHLWDAVCGSSAVCKYPSRIIIFIQIMLRRNIVYDTSLRFCKLSLGQCFKKVKSKVIVMSVMEGQGLEISSGKDWFHFYNVNLVFLSEL